MNRSLLAGMAICLAVAGCDDLTFGSSVGGVQQAAPATAGSVKAMGLILQRTAPGGGHLVEAQLQLVNPGAVDRTVPVGDLRLLIGDQPLTLFAVANNFYQSASTDDFGTLAPGTPITLSLTAALPAGAKTLTAELQLPAASTLRLPETAEPIGTGQNTAIELRGADRGSLLIISPYNDWGGAVTYDLLADAGAGAATSARIDRWFAAASAFTGPDEVLPASAFPVSGNYWVEVIALSPVHGTATTAAGWASGSWFAAGNATGAPLLAP